MGVSTTGGIQNGWFTMENPINVDDSTRGTTMTKRKAPNVQDPWIVSLPGPFNLPQETIRSNSDVSHHPSQSLDFRQRQ